MYILYVYNINIYYILYYTLYITYRDATHHVFHLTDLKCLLMCTEPKIPNGNYRVTYASLVSMPLFIALSGHMPAGCCFV